jgi:hypothetical protein
LIGKLEVRKSLTNCKIHRRLESCAGVTRASRVAFCKLGKKAFFLELLQQ